MTAVVVLLGYAVLLAALGPRLMRQAAWADRAPRLAIIAWQCLTVSVLAAVALAGLALLIPTTGGGANLAQLLRACAMALRACAAALRAQYATPGGAAAGTAGAIVVSVILARTLWCLGRVLYASHCARSRHRAVLDLVGSSAPHLGATVLPSDRPAVYCLPGRSRRIVVTTGALRLLDDRQVALVLRHEEAHARQRHDLVLAWPKAVASAFPRVPLFVLARVESARLVELLADDAATVHGPDRLILADALLTLSGSPTPAAAFGAGGSTAAARVRRLLGPRHPLDRMHTALIAAAAAGLLLVPLMVATGPIAAALTGDCPVRISSVAGPHSGTSH